MDARAQSKFCQRITKLRPWLLQVQAVAETGRLAALPDDELPEALRLAVEVIGDRSFAVLSKVLAPLSGGAKSAGSGGELYLLPGAGRFRRTMADEPATARAAGVALTTATRLRAADTRGPGNGWVGGTVIRPSRGRCQARHGHRLQRRGRTCRVGVASARLIIESRGVRFQATASARLPDGRDPEEQGARDRIHGTGVQAQVHRPNREVGR